MNTRRRLIAITIGITFFVIGALFSMKGYAVAATCCAAVSGNLLASAAFSGGAS